MDLNQLKQNPGLKIGSLTVALLLWFHIATEKDTYERTIEIPLLVTGVPSGQVVSQEIPATQFVRFRGKGKRLLMLPWGDVMVRLDASGVSTRQTFTLDLEHVIHPEGLEVLEVLPPNQVTVVLDRRMSVRLPVRINLQVEIAQGYTQVGSARADPDSVTIFGPAGSLRRLTYVETDSVTVRRARGPVDRETPLVIPQIYNLVVEPATVRVLLDVQELSERTFTDIPITFVGTDRPQRFLAQPRTANVTVRGGVELIERLRSEDIRLVVDISSHIPDSLTPVVPLVELPEGLTLLRTDPGSVRVTEY